jgi:hypothetical protein
LSLGHWTPRLQVHVSKPFETEQTDEDKIINDYIKSTSNRFIHIYEKLFNIIFDRDILPQSWLNGIIKPIKCTI